MATLNRLDMPDSLYEFLERRARDRGISVAEQVVRDLTHVQQEELDEERLMEEISAGREEMAARGVFLTDEMIREAKRWGRE